MREDVDQGSVSREEETVMEKVEWRNIGKYSEKNRHNQKKALWLVCFPLDKV